MKILVVRFSSIGDIVLTTPVLRCLKQQLPDAEIHYLTKTRFKALLETNPYADRLICINKSFTEVIDQLRAEKYDVLIDLHHNIRTLRLKNALKVKAYAFPKLNFSKWLLVYLKWNRMPDRHVVDRYFDAVLPLGVKHDGKGADFFLTEHDHVHPLDAFGYSNYVAMAIGAQYATKRMPEDKLCDLLAKIDSPVILLGDGNDALVAERLCAALPERKIINACGRYSLRQSASIVAQCRVLVTHDTGLMHIAAAFGKPIVSIWGNTVPALGMFPYLPGQPHLFSMHQVPDLNCRPCSKIGYKKCPRGHFKCMQLQDTDVIAADVESR